VGEHHLAAIAPVETDGEACLVDGAPQRVSVLDLLDERYNEVYQLNARILSMGMLREDQEADKNFLMLTRHDIREVAESIVWSGSVADKKNAPPPFAMAEWAVEQQGDGDRNVFHE
jgi:hypothetical protein